MKNKKIQYIFDIDGCLTAGKNESIDIKSMKKLKKIINKDNSEISICTGRAQGYVETFFQLLVKDNNNQNNNAVCEHGSYIYSYSKDKIDILSKDKSKIYDKLPKGFLENHLEPGQHIVTTFKYKPEIHNYKKLIKKIKKEVKNHKNLDYKYNLTTFEIYYKETGKENAVDKIIEDNHFTFGIGDSQADIEWLKKVDFAACPSNSAQEVKDICDYVSPYSDIKGTIDSVKKYKKWVKRQ